MNRSRWIGVCMVAVAVALGALHLWRHVDGYGQAGFVLAVVGVLLLLPSIPNVYED